MFRFVNRSRCIKATLLGALVWTLSSLSGGSVSLSGAESVVNDDRFESVEFSAWLDEEDRPLGKSLNLTLQTPLCVVSRLFVRVGGVHAVVITSEASFGDSAIHQSFVDNSSGWRFSISMAELPRIEGDGFPADYREVIRLVEEKEGRGDRVETRVTARVTGLEEWSKSWEMLPEEYEEAGRDFIFASLEESGFGRDLALGVPESAVGSIRAVESTICSGGEAAEYCSQEEILVYVSRFLAGHLPAPSELIGGHQRNPRQARSALLASSRSIDFGEQEREFLRGFRSLDLERPLAETCASRSVSQEVSEP